jgi:hypothetical protein
LTWDDVAKISPDGVHLPEAANRAVPSAWEDPQSFDVAAVRDEVEKMVEEAGIELEPFDRFRS